MRTADACPVKRLVIATLLIVALGACGAPGSTTVPSVAVSSPSPSASEAATPSTDPSAETGGTTGLVLRLTWCQDVCVSNPGTTVLEDGRVIWRNETMWVERQLTATGLAELLDRVDAAGVFDADGDYSPQLRPGAQPQPRGLTSYAFTALRDTTRVRVTTGDPEEFASEAALWIVPPEMAGLAAFAEDLMNPAASFPDDAWAGGPIAFRPPGYLLIVTLRRDDAARADLTTDVDDVAWSLSAPIDTIGEPYVQNGEVVPDTRCLPISAALAARIAAAERSAGSKPFIDNPYDEISYHWARGNGSATIETRWLMPDQPWSCTAPSGW